jgi:hypothetical protein
VGVRVVVIQGRYTRRRGQASGSRQAFVLSYASQRPAKGGQGKGRCVIREEARLKAGQGVREEGEGREDEEKREREKKGEKERKIQK